MTIKEQLRDNPSDFKCCHCGIDFPKRMTMVGQGILTKGQIWVCSNCCKVSILGDVGLQPMSKEQFDALPKSTQAAVAATAFGIKKRIDEGGSWNPYEQPKKQ